MERKTKHIPVENSAPSIGSVELSYDPTGNRVRQIIGSVIEEPSDITRAMNAAHEEATSRQADRCLIRAIVPQDQVGLISNDISQYGWNVEASIPLNGRYDGHFFVYLGVNGQHRCSVPEVIRAEQNIVEKINEKPVKKPADVLNGVRKKGFKLEHLHELVETDRARLVEIYQSSFDSYPFDIEQDIEKMINDPDTHVYVARNEKDGQIYGISATERVVLPDSGLVIREMGDTARFQGPEGKGLTAALKLMLIAEAYNSGEGTDIVFCESRAALWAVNDVNHSIGMHHRGVLSKHTVISGPATVDEVDLDGDMGIYGNMNVWAVNSHEIAKIAQNVNEVTQSWN